MCFTFLICGIDVGATSLSELLLFYHNQLINFILLLLTICNHITLQSAIRDNDTVRLTGDREVSDVGWLE